MSSFYIGHLVSLFTKESFKGWGRKRTGFLALWLSKLFKRDYVLLEDGFIRSVGLGEEDSFSIVEDNIGIYYDATSPSRLEDILNNHRFTEDEISLAKQAIGLIIDKKISKYNTGDLSLPSYLKEDDSKKVLIVAQTKGDMSLKYGRAYELDEKQMIQDAIKDNPNSKIYLKIHPDVLAGKKESSIDIEFAKKHCIVISENINPIVLLEVFEKVYTQTSQMGFEALLLEKEVVTYGVPFYSNWGLTNDKLICDRRCRSLSVEELFVGAYILYTRYYNPYLKQPTDIIDAIQTIVRYRELYRSNNGNLYFFGFKLWKRRQTKLFFKALNQNQIHFCINLSDALKKGLNKDAKVYIWGKKEYEEVKKFCIENNIKSYTVEDGFIRSIALGSDLTKAYSLVVDSRGIYFDPTQESDLEYILSSYNFDNKLLERADKLKKYIIDKGLSKYNIYQDKELNFNVNQKVILVVGQVEDDASIVYGGNGMSNLELLEKVYQKRKNDFIVYKPHPDVEAGNREGKIEKEIVLKYANILISDISLPSLIDKCDELHTITSLSGFEALIRGKKVYTYGMPFYAGWGLTKDEKICTRRRKKLNINELVAATYILYPRYISPSSNTFCEVETLVVNLDIMKKRYNNRLYKVMIDMRNIILRVLQLMIRSLL